MWALVLVLLAGPQAPDPAARAGALLQKEAELADTLDAVDRQIAQVTREHERTRLSLGTMKTELERVEERRAVAALNLDERKAKLRKRLQARQRLNDLGVLRVLMRSTDLPDLVRRRRYLHRVLGADLELLAALKADSELLEVLHQRKRSAAEQLGAAETAFRLRRVALEAERAVRSEIYASIRKERGLVERVLAARRRQRRALDAEVAREPVSFDDTGFAAERGKLIAPVAGRVVRRFGKFVDPELGTETFHGGWALDAALGTPVRVVAGGRVVYSGWYKGFGNLIIVDHGDRYHTLYAHLAAVSTGRGEQVERGSIIGEVGDTGSLRGVQLYFELRKAGRPQNPARWLRRTK